jgi:hypothetical protein
MRNIRLSILVFLIGFMSNGAFAQFVDITPIVGYAIHGDLKFIEGNMEINDKLNIGAIASFPTYNEKGMLELNLSNSFASGHWAASSDYDSLISKTNFNMMVTYFQVAWAWEGEVDDDLYIFGGPSMGFVTYVITKSDIVNIFRVSLGMQMGLKYFFQRGLGFRLQAQLILPVFMGNGEHFRGITDYPGTNSYVTVNTTNFPVNLLIDAGIIFRIKFRR